MTWRGWLMCLVAVQTSSCRDRPVPVPAPVVDAPAPVAAAPPSRFTWHVYGDAVELRQEEGAAGCTVTCLKGNTAAWSLPACIGLDSDFRFVAEDCSAAVVLFEFPRAADPLEDTPAGFVWSGDQDPRPLFLKNFVRNPSKLYRNGRFVGWLAGTVGAPGAAPRKRPAGDGVAFEGRDGAAQSLTFAALRTGALPVVSSGWQSATGKGGLYQWEDGSGSVQISDYSAIPKDRRAQARPISGEISVVKNDSAVRIPAAAPNGPYGRGVRDLSNPLKRLDPSQPGREKSFTELELEAEAARRQELESDHAAEKAAKERAANPPAPVFRNSRGENWIEYHNRLAQEARNNPNYWRQVR